MSETSQITSKNVDDMWTRAAFLTRLLASSVRVAETAGKVIKTIAASSADLKIVDKSAGQNDLQTEADRSAQYCIERSLQKKFDNTLHIIGEEAQTSEVPDLELGVSEEVLRLDDKLPKELRQACAEDVVVWVDPLDGTSEFANAIKTSSALLEQVTVLIGIAYKGKSVAGVIHQPFFNKEGRTVWGIVGLGAFGATLSQGSSERVIVTSRSHLTPLGKEALNSLLEKKLADRLEGVGGAGYKVLKCLEGATAYVFASPGCKKWDTAAPEAVIRAAGGDLTDISGRRLNYNADVQQLNSGGVIATASWVEHKKYVDAIPNHVKNGLYEFVKND